MSRLLTAAAAALALSGCASPVEPPSEWARNTRALPALPAKAMRVIANAELIDTKTFEISPQAREDFDKEREARVRWRIRSAFSGLESPGQAGIFLLPLLIPIYVLHAARAENAEPSLIPVEDSTRLAALFRARATSVALAERSSQLLGAEPEGGVVLKVGVVSVEHERHSDGDVSMTLRAEAQAVSPGGAALPVTEHYVKLHQRGMRDWSSEDYAATRREIDRALDLLARSIGATYRPTAVAAPDERLPYRMD